MGNTQHGPMQSSWDLAAAIAKSTLGTPRSRAETLSAGGVLSRDFNQLSSQFTRQLP